MAEGLQRDLIVTWREVRPGDRVLVGGQLVLALEVSTYEDDWQGHKWMRTDLRYRDDDGRIYSTGRWTDRDYTAVRREVDAARATAGKPPPCDYDTGTAYTGPGKCGRPSKFIWADETSGKDRPVCGIHARSARITMHGEVRPLAGKDGK